jgi:hypothetical protein
VDGTGTFQRRLFKLGKFGFRVHLLVLCCIDVSSCQVTAKDLKLSSPQTCRDRSFQLHQKKHAELKKGMNENEDSHLGFKFPVKAPEFVGAVLFLFLMFSLIKVSMVSKLHCQCDCLVCEGGALDDLPDSISRPRPTTMLFYVRHRADGRKKSVRPS